MSGENRRRGLPEATRPPAASPYNAKDSKTIPSSHQTKTPPNINLAGYFSKTCRFILLSLRRVRHPLCDHINLGLGCRSSAGGRRRYLLHSVNHHSRLGLGVQALFDHADRRRMVRADLAHRHARFDYQVGRAAYSIHRYFSRCNAACNSVLIGNNSP